MKLPTPALLLCSLFATPGILPAKDGDVIARSQGTGGSTCKLKASPQNGRIEVEYELDQARPGHRWQIVLKKNKRRILRTTQTVNIQGNIELRKLTGDGPGRERISARARNLLTGERCKVSLRF